MARQHGSSFLSNDMNRRLALKTLGIGAMGLAAAPLLAACTGTTAGGGGKAGTATSFGSNFSGDVSKPAILESIKTFEKESGYTVKINSFSHDDFQQNINNYLQGNPDPVFSWFSGRRMRGFAGSGLVLPVDDVWSGIDKHYGESVREACTAEDGNKYLVPWNTYPWAVFYRKSLFEEKGWEIPTTWDDFLSLCEAIKKDGITPIAFADKETWPAFGTFDQLNLRINGYEFHMRLMAHEESWDQKKVLDVFDHWTEIMPYHQAGSLGRNWSEAANSIADKSSAMYVIGLGQIGGQITGEDQKDLDFFPFPEINPEHGQDSVEAPIEGFMLSKEGKDDKVAHELLKYFGSGEAQIAYLKTNPLAIAASKDADTSSYTDLQKRAVSMVSDAKHLSQFLDNDALPAFASSVMAPALQTFISDGKFDARSVEEQAKQKYGDS